MSNKRIIQVGEKFNKLTIIKEIDSHIYPNGQKRRKFLCLCVCGNMAYVLINNLFNGNTTSCGCYQKEMAKNTQTKHNDCDSVEYQCWAGIIKRCTNKNSIRYQYYGGRGISVCERWRNSYSNFLEDMGRKPGDEFSIDRINNDGDYEPGNCKWATYSEQAYNRRPKTK